MCVRGIQSFCFSLNKGLGETSIDGEVKFSAGTGSRAPETELQQGAPNAHPTQNGATTISSPVIVAPTHSPNSPNKAANSSPPAGESRFKGNNEILISILYKSI